jgi:hypothetical protein
MIRNPVSLLIVLAALIAAAPSRAQETSFRAELPVLVTSSGQSLAAFTVKTTMTRASVPNEYKPLATVDDVKNFKTVVIAFGASVKGFGAAGITAVTELARTQDILKVAREKKIALIGVHIGGAEGREGLSKQFVELVAGAVDLLIVWDDGNSDGYFTKVAAQAKIPLILLRQPVEVGATLKQVFGK